VLPLIVVDVLEQVRVVRDYIVDSAVPVRLAAFVLERLHMKARNS